MIPNGIVTPLRKVTSQYFSALLAAGPQEQHHQGGSPVSPGDAMTNRLATARSGSAPIRERTRLRVESKGSPRLSR
jgi:hypothetical protein